MATVEERLATIEKYVEDRKQQQITLPLDEKSQSVLNEYFLAVVRSFIFTNPSGMDFNYYVVQQGGKTIIMGGENNLVGYVANSTTDFINAGQNIVTGEQITAMANGTQVILWTTGATPAGLSTGGVIYYVVNSTGSSFQLSLTFGGAAENFTDNGTGEQFFQMTG